jgi:nucleoside-diphosphate-sugar epimerase
LGREQAIGHAFHITSDEVLTWNQIYREAGHAIGVEPNLIHIPSDLIGAFDPETMAGLIGDKANCAIFDNRKIKRWVPDFVATVPWSEGVRRAIAWYEADPLRCTIDEEANRVWDTIIAAYGRALPRA